MAALDELYDAIIEYPNDMPPRIIYGMQVGGDQGELIDLQLRADEAWKDGIAAPAMIRIHQLLENPVRNEMWAEPLLPEAKLVAFYRGFVEHVEVDATWFIGSAERLFQSAPIRHLDVTGLGSPDACDAFFDCGWLGLIHGLALPAGFDKRALHGLATSRHLKSLDYLWLPDGSFTDEELAAILEGRPSLHMFSSRAFDEIHETDLDGGNVFISPSDRTMQFESRYGKQHALHVMERNRFASRMIF